MLSQALLVALAQWSPLSPMQTVTRLFRVSWQAPNAVVKRVASCGLQCRSKTGVMMACIDEISRRRGHIDRTQVYDLGKVLLASVPGRDGLHCGSFPWGAVGIASCKPRRYVAAPHLLGSGARKPLHGHLTLRNSGRERGCSMWIHYIEVIKEYVLRALVVFGRFPPGRQLLPAVDQVRRPEPHRVRRLNPEPLKGTRSLGLKSPWNLRPQERQRLDYLERLNRGIFRAYLLREHFRERWQRATEQEAERLLSYWLEWAFNYGLGPVGQFASLLSRHGDGVLGYMELPVDNHVVGAMNGSAKAISMRARGYRWRGGLLHRAASLSRYPRKAASRARIRVRSPLVGG
ncbi:MAG: transposase [candidate division KSB1 bacterium]|nr:transposase [candidate division KSB1 bacterium]